MSETIAPQPVLVTERLRLRPLRASDAGLVALYASDPRVARMTADIPHPYPPGAAEAFIERVRSPKSRQTAWAIDTGEDDENGLVGVIGVKQREPGVGDLGYWVAPAFWGTGYASEAVEAVATWAAGAGFRTLQAEVLQDNAASAKVLVRDGFAYVGDGEVHALARGAMVPTFRYVRGVGL